MLKMDRAKAKWRIKLQKAFDGQRKTFFLSVSNHWVNIFLCPCRIDVDGRTNSGKWVLFVLPLVTVLREGTRRS